MDSSGIIQDGVKVAKFTSAADWIAYGGQAAGSAVSVDTTTHFESGSSIKFTSTATGNVKYRYYNTRPLDLSVVDVFSIWVDWTPVSSSTTCTIYFSSGAAAAFADVASVNIFGSVTGSQRKDGGKYSITWRKSAMTISNAGATFDWASITNVMIGFNMQAAGETPKIGALYCGKRRQTNIILGFDDGVNSSDFPMMTHAATANAAGIPVTHYVIPEFVGATDYVSLSDLNARQSAGDLVAVHAAPNGGNYSAGDYSASEVYDDLVTLRQYFISNNFSGHQYFAWPGGRYWNTGTSESYIQAAYDAGFKSARSIIGIVQTSTGIERINMGLIEPMIINAISLSGPNNERTAAALLAEVDKAISLGTSVFFYGHKISVGAATPTDYEITGTEYGTFISGLQARISDGKCSAVTHKDFYESLQPVTQNRSSLIPSLIGSVVSTG